MAIETGWIPACPATGSQDVDARCEDVNAVAGVAERVDAVCQATRGLWAEKILRAQV